MLQRHLRRSEVWWAGFVAVLLVVTAYNLLNTLDNGLLPDEQICMMMTKEMAVNSRVYTTFIDHYPPGMAMAGVPFVWLLGNTAVAAKAAVVFYTVLFTGAVGCLARTLTRTRWGTWLAVGLAGFFGSLYAVAVGVNVSSYAAIFVTVGAACAVHSTRARYAAAWMLLGGIVVGLGFMSKPSIVLEVPVLAALFYWMTRRWQPVVIFLGGVTLAIVGVFVYYATIGTLYEMFYVSFVMNFTYLGTSLLDVQIQGDAGQRATFVQSHLLGSSLPHYSGLFALTLILAAWHWRRARQHHALIMLLLLWALVAFIESVMPLAMALRYFFHIITPLAILAALGAESLRTERRSLVVLGASVPLLAAGAYIAYDLFPADMYASRERYENSIAFLDDTLAEDDCVLTWGWLSGLNFYSDHDPCARIATDGNMFPRGVYDIRQQRSWYLEDILNTQPALVAVQDTWSFFPQMAQLVDNRQPRSVFSDPHVPARYLTLDWSSYHVADGEIAGELKLHGYDVRQADTITPGSDVLVTLYWEVLAVPAQDYQGFVHLAHVDNYAAKIAAQDASPTEPFEPVSEWLQGMFWVGRTYRLTIPADTPPGEYTLITGMYTLDANNNVIPLDHRLSEDGESASYLTLDTVTVTGVR